MKFLELQNQIEALLEKAEAELSEEDYESLMEAVVNMAKWRLGEEEEY